MTRAFTMLVACAACSTKSSPAKNAAADSAAPATSSALAAAPGQQCPATGLWAQCSVMYRLERSGLEPRIDSTERPKGGSLHGAGFVVKIGRLASVDVFLYPDSAARIADERMLDRTEFVNAATPQTIRRERTLIENANLIALLTSLNDHQRERISDALTAGAPQAPQPPLR